MANACTYKCMPLPLPSTGDSSRRINHSIAHSHSYEPHKHTLIRANVFSLFFPFLEHFFWFCSRCIYSPVSMQPLLCNHNFLFGCYSGTFSSTVYPSQWIRCICAFGFNLFIYLLRCNILPLQFIALEFCWKNKQTGKGVLWGKMARSARRAARKSTYEHVQIKSLVFWYVFWMWVGGMAWLLKHITNEAKRMECAQKYKRNIEIPYGKVLQKGRRRWRWWLISHIAPNVS